MALPASPGLATESTESTETPAHIRTVVPLPLPPTRCLSQRLRIHMVGWRGTQIQGGVRGSVFSVDSVAHVGELGGPGSVVAPFITYPKKQEEPFSCAKE